MLGNGSKAVEKRFKCRPPLGSRTKEKELENDKAK